MSAEEWREWASENEIIGVPFADATARVPSRFSALGIEWTITPATADQSARLGAQRLAAAASVLSVELATLDLCLLPGKIDVDVAVQSRSSDAQEDFHPFVNDRPDGRWQVTLGGGGDWLSDPHRVSHELFAVLIAILSERSLLPLQDLARLVTEDVFRAAVGSLFAARSFDLMVSELFDDLPDLRSECDLLWQAPASPEHSSLSWRDDLAPGYDAEEARKSLQTRYAKLGAACQITLPRFLADDGFAANLRALREDGLLDWQILQAIHGVVSGYRLPADATNWSREQIQEFLLQPESPDMDEVPLELFSVESLRKGARAGMLATLQALGLESHADHPDYEAIRTFLSARYRYLTDDIEHPPVFGAD
jgi:hypothetical protein